MKRSHALTEASLHTLASWLDESDAVLVGAGAGLSADAGFDFGDERDFARRFPALARQGFRSRAQFVGRDDLPPELRWAYYLDHVREVRFGPAPKPVYDDLLALLRGKDHFVVTTNADGLFERSGFDPSRVTTPQGDYSRWQCLTPCTQETWPTSELIERALPKVDPSTGWLPEGAAPRCPRCGGDTFLNVRGGDWFVEEPYAQGWSRYRAWLSSRASKRTLILDVGTGFNTPTWIRWPCETLTRTRESARLARINLREPEVPADLGARALAIGARPSEVFTRLLRRRAAA